MAAGESQNFTVGAVDPDNNISKWEWFVDGVSMGGQSLSLTGSIFRRFSYTFSDPGFYIVEAQFTDAAGESNSVFWFVEVSATAPPASGDCFQDTGTLTGSVTRAGSWTGVCGSTHQDGGYARFYAFTLDTQTAVQIDLTSSEDTYLYLLSGSDSDGRVIAENDDAAGQGTNSRITETLASGTYTVEATTYGSGTTGSFDLTIAPGGTGTGPPASGDCFQDTGTLTGSVTRAGSWTGACGSTHRDGGYARFYAFTLDTQTAVQIDLTSSEDTYLYLLSGSDSDGRVIAENDDAAGQGTNSRITETLASGTYTVEATTYGSGTTGSFDLTIAPGGTGTGPPASGDCFQDTGTLTGSVTRAGSWTGVCGSTHRDGGYARFYAFTLDTQTAVQIDLTSSEDTYLYLLSGSDSDGRVIAENDDAAGQGTNSRITETLASGTYTVEATTYGSGTTGSFDLTIAPGGTGTGPPASGDCFQDTGTLTGSVTRAGSWTGACGSTHRDGGYARFYAFTLDTQTAVQIDLTSSEDTYLYLLSGSDSDGRVIAENDDAAGQGTNSRITETLASGTYTVEATTYGSGTTGSFDLTIAPGGTGTGPPASGDCFQDTGTLTGSVTRAGSWTGVCGSTHRDGGYARFYAFTLDTQTAVQIDLTSSEDTYLYLLSGSDSDGRVIAENDDAAGQGTNSRITETLASGTYTVEATTYGSGTTGSFDLTIAPGGTGTGPPASGDCFQDTGTLTGSVTRAGSWTGACGSTHRDGGYARFYAFTLDTQTAVQIDLTSSEDTYLYLLSGSDSDGRVIAENDDAAGQGTNSRITETLASGTYTVEATTYGSGTTGSFDLTIAPGGTGTGPPTGNCESTVTSGPTPVQGGLGGVAITGRWVVGCDSVHRSGRNASYISFTQESPGQVIITLESSVDTYLYLLQGEGGSGTVLASNDDYDGGGSNSQITRFLPPGRYTVEATTYRPSVTGEFTLTLSSITVTPVSLGAPENLTATPSGSTAIDLSWDPPSSLGGTPIRGYQIQVRRLGEAWRDVVTNTRSTATSHSHANLITGNRYYYRVAAIDSLGAGPWSNSADATAGAGLAGPDLIAEVTGPRNGTILEPGDSFTFSVRVRNIGDTQASSTTLRYYRSTDSRISSNDTQLDTDPVSSLASAGTETESTRVNVPLAGTFYFYGCVDSVSGESDTNNNCSNVIVVTAEDAASGPDLIAEVTGPRNGTILEPGDSFTFSVRVRNIGDTQASSTTLRYYRSTDSRISSNDTQLDTDPVSSLASAGTETESTRVNVPLAGTFYFYGCVDSVSGESDTNNNCSNVIVVTAEDAASGPDLIAEVTGPRNGTILEPGDSFTFSARVRNIGDTQASSTTLRYYRSTDSRISSNDTQLDTDPVSSLAFGWHRDRINTRQCSVGRYLLLRLGVRRIRHRTTTLQREVVTAEDAASGPDLIAESQCAPWNRETPLPSLSGYETLAYQASSTTLRYYHSSTGLEQSPTT